MFSRRLSETEVVRAVATSDAEELHALIAANRGHLARWLAWVEGQTSVDTRVFVARARGQVDAGEGLQAAILVSGRIVGMIGFTQVSRANRAARVGYWLAESAQRHGTMTRAVVALVDHAFADWRLNRVEIRAAVENTRSRAIPRRLGFREEGLLCQAERVGERYVDLVVYGMLAREWSERASELLRSGREL